MAVRSLLSMVRMAVRQGGTFSSSPAPAPGIVYGLSNALSQHVHGSPMLDAALSRFAGSRGIHSREAAQTASSLGTPAAEGARRRRLHVLKDVITEHADGAFAAVTVAVSSAFAGVWYWMKDTADKSSVILMGGEDPAMNIDEYLRKVQAALDVQRAMDSYYEAFNRPKAVL